MVRVKIEDIVDHLRHEMTSALGDAVKETMPGMNVNEQDLFSAFRRAVGRKCNFWETVPDNYVEK